MATALSDIEEAGRVLADPTAYADEPRLHAAMTLLRREQPVAKVIADNYRPFWAITKHDDIMDIERNNALWINEPRPLLMNLEQEAELDKQAAMGIELKTLVHIDDPKHRVLRAIGADWFRPKAMRDMKLRTDELAARYVNKLLEAGGTCDFAQDVAVHFPLYVIMSLLGIPESDFDRMLKLTQELFGGDDTEFQRGATPEEQLLALLDFFGYFSGLTASRRENPTDDLASTIANAKVDGELLSDVDTASYYTIIATAGHDTTSATIAGGLEALLEHPDQLARLREHPNLMPLAVDEMIRWVTPVKEFMRTATADTEIRGVPIAEGESVLLSYPSGNRDEDTFTDPFTFDIARDPNKHLAFGFGVHFCLGAALARMEVNSFFSALLPRLESIEIDGNIERTSTIFVGGIKHLPIRYTLR
ncbi:cytochrome P450 [Mycobacteroides immunogenum]|uniref:Cytochrome n=1 Tax=Mycobacteroides immunogenum TaxID=83262 RepID=A0A7V8LN10_9MYCO|nr:cytochrome P450 [Mycobacteroides immunogenum]AMT72488.1 cytochrome P450 [Mycobacteroides immunogenum]ANO05646.1 cytochrome [Mycobacteroides immunogenum]KIU41448.1 cytochrome P450 [Mycobacteroides immunogenum]KPG06464.1 cytochrome [Mycobacteroides immunogenum]KPG08249.1 cytochrome [Mycobacteroides immunogenum]